MSKLFVSFGFHCISDHRSCCWREQSRVLVVVYVDDIKIAGPPKSCEQVWKRLRAKVKTDEPTPDDSEPRLRRSKGQIVAIGKLAEDIDLQDPVLKKVRSRFLPAAAHAKAPRIRWRDKEMEKVGGSSLAKEPGKRSMGLFQSARIGGRAHGSPA